MLLLTLTCVFICAALIALVVIWQRTRKAQPELVQEKALYAGFVNDLDRRLAKGEVDDAQATEERAQAARALLKVSESTVESGPVKPLHGYIALGLIAVLSAALYLFVGHPAQEDQPYKQRLQT